MTAIAFGTRLYRFEKNNANGMLTSMPEAKKKANSFRLGLWMGIMQWDSEFGGGGGGFSIKRLPD